MAGPVLRLAAGADHLLAVHQPIVDLRTGRTVAVEGLVRGARGDEPVPPAELFATAGAAGPAAVLELDGACVRCVLDSAAPLGPGATLFVNVEPVTLAALSGGALAELAARVPAGVQVVVEVTERDLLRQPARLLAGVERVRELGWGVALDDVGAEPAALALVPFLRPDVLKLDLALVRARPTLDAAAIINAVNAEAQRSGALVLAEGVETPEHLRRALSTGARLGQGWHFGRPGPLPREWGAPLRLPPPRPRPPVAATAFELISRSVPAQPTTPALLAPLTRHVEHQAMLLDEATVVLASFQHADLLTPATLRRYESLARVTALTAVLAPGVRPEPAPGVLGTALHEDHPLGREWVVTVVSPHFAAALAARDAPGPARAPGDGRRSMEYVLTYDRDQVVAAARLLMAEVRAPAVAARAPRSPREPGPAVADGATAVPGVPPAELPALLTRAVSTASNGIVIADARAPDVPLVYVNRAFEELTGYRREEVLGRNCRLLQGPGSDPAQVRVLARRLLAGRHVRMVLLNYRRDGSSFWNEITVSPVHDAQGRLTHFIGNQVDVSDRVDREQRTARLARHDPLTGLPDRAGALEDLALELRRSARSGTGVGVVLVDLDGFGAVNDRFGRSGGDEVLLRTAQRLQSVARPGDLLARLDGDEFLLVLTGLPADGDEVVQRAVEHLRTALEPPVEVAGGAVRLSASTGSALSPRDGSDPAALVGAADARRHRAGRGT